MKINDVVIAVYRGMAKLGMAMQRPLAREQSKARLEPKRCWHGFDCTIDKCPLGFPGCHCADDVVDDTTMDNKVGDFLSAMRRLDRVMPLEHEDERDATLEPRTLDVSTETIKSWPKMDLEHSPWNNPDWRTEALQATEKPLEAPQSDATAWMTLATPDVACDRCGAEYCVHCAERLIRVPGGNGPVYIHEYGGVKFCRKT